MSLYKKLVFNQNTGDYGNTEIIQLNDRWVIAQRGNLSFSVGNGVLQSSIDNSETFPKSLTYAETDKINNAHIMKNGNILFTTSDNKIFLTNINFDFLEQKTVIKEDGTELVPHTPVNSNYPGRYFYTHRYMTPTDETDLYLWGNYCNVNYGAAPVNVFYTADFGQTVKVAYGFGVHPYHKDDGTIVGGDTGTELGNPNSTIKTRHTHCVEYCPYNGKWYCATGDHNTFIDEIHWMEGIYDAVNDSWTWVKIDFGIGVIPQTSYLKIIEIFFFGGYLHWNTDATNIDEGSDVNGIYRVPLELLADTTKHEKILDYPENKDYSSNMKFDPKSGIVLFSIANQQRTIDKASTLAIATENGTEELQYKDFTGNNFIRMSSPNEKGFFRLDTNKFPTSQGKTFFIKPGYDLFNNIT